MPDLMRIGGVTGWLRAAAVAAAWCVDVSTHLYPEISSHLMRVTPTAHCLEWQDWLLPGRRRVVPYSIQWLKRRRPAQFREDLAALLELLRTNRIKPLVARRFPLAEARRAHELLGKGGVAGKLVLVTG